MGTFNEVPLYTDTRHLSGPQSRKINSMLKSLYNEIDARGIQKKESAPKKGENPISALSPRVIEVIATEYDGTATVHIPSLDLSNMIGNTDYVIARLSDSYSRLQWNGWLDEGLTMSVADIGYFMVNGQDIIFTCTANTDSLTFAGVTLTVWK